MKSLNVCQLLVRVYAVRRFLRKPKRIGCVSQIRRGSDQFAWTDGCCKQAGRNAVGPTKKQEVKNSTLNHVKDVTGYEKRAHFAHYVNCQYRAKSANRIYFRRISIIASYVSTMFTLSSGQVSDQDSFPRLRMRPEHLNVSRMLSVHRVDRKCSTDVLR